MISEHKPIKRYKQYMMGDFYCYSLDCSCGLVLHEWSIKEIEKKFKEHQDSEAKYHAR